MARHNGNGHKPHHHATYKEEGYGPVYLDADNRAAGARQNPWTGYIESLKSAAWPAVNRLVDAPSQSAVICPEAFTGACANDAQDSEIAATVRSRLRRIRKVIFGTAVPVRNDSSDQTVPGLPKPLEQLANVEPPTGEHLGIETIGLWAHEITSSAPIAERLQPLTMKLSSSPDWEARGPNLPATPPRAPPIQQKKHFRKRLQQIPTAADSDI